MSARAISLRCISDDPARDRVDLETAFERIRREADVPDAFPDEVVEEARQVASTLPLPERDETAVPFMTVDPAGSMDLDQATHIERAGEGYRVRYAIADVAAWVRPGGALDTEARRRGQTIYSPDRRVPLHPAELSEGAASLLPGQVTPALVWDIELDADGERVAVDLYRARVRSVERFDYETVQTKVDAGTAPQTWMLLREVGEKLIRLESQRGGASLPMPEQVVEVTDEGYEVRLRPLLPAEDWNAQISLLAGMAAAEMMLHARIGILRTMPPADPRDVQRFRRQAQALGAPWPAEMVYGDFLRTLDRDNPRHLALIHAATTLFRGAGYTPFEGDLPEVIEHSAIAAPYAHVTAPLRRLVDRFGLEICAAVAAGEEVPDWVREALMTLPALMTESDRRARQVERAATDAVEAASLQHCVGREFEGTVVTEGGKRGVEVQIAEPPVLAHARGEATPGDVVRVRLVRADVAEAKVEFELL